MYDYPPVPWKSNTWEMIGYDVLWLLLGTCFVFLFHRAKEKPFVFDAAATLIVGLVLNLIFLAEDRQSPGRPNAHPLFLILTWAMVTGMTLRSWKHLFDAGDRKSAIGSIQATVAVMLLAGCCMLPNSTGLTTSIESARRIECRNNLKQISLAVLNYHDVHRTLPFAKQGRPPHSWRVAMLPFIDNRVLYRKYDFDTAWDNGINLEIATETIRVYQCPSNRFFLSEEGHPTTAYATLIGTNTLWSNKSGWTFSDISDGSSNTLLVVEACGQRIPWSRPKDVELSHTKMVFNAPGNSLGRSEGAFSSEHSGTINVAFADGSTRSISNQIDPEILNAITTPNGNESEHDF